MKMAYPDNYSYSKEHEWILVEDGVATLGITAFAQDELGEIVYVEMPEEGDEFEAGASIGSIESVKATSEIYTPVGGEIVGVNKDLDDAPEKVNDDPHSDGWLVKIKIRGEAEGLMDAAAYEELIKGDG
jgi:glycine cleavage system H protein